MEIIKSLRFFINFVWRKLSAHRDGVHPSDNNSDEIYIELVHKHERVKRNGTVI